jgi:hypothetical protein
MPIIPGPVRQEAETCATRYGIALGQMNGIVLFGYEIAAYLPSGAYLHNGAALILAVPLLVLRYAVDLHSPQL